MTTKPPRIPRLCNGDRLNADEFLRRYEAMPGVKAQLIGGIVYITSPLAEEDVCMASPLRAEHHGDPHAEVMGWLWLYKSATPGVQPSVAATVRLADESVSEPDASLRVVRGGRTRVEGGYIVGGPELAVEIAASSVNIDRNAKLEDYRANGVQEYFIWRFADGEIDWFRLDGGRYEPLAADGGVLKSAVFPGLWLDPAALLGGDTARVEAVLRQGLATPEHAAFVARLAAVP
ncbi:MAG: Uma2 family endonuclease [Gemmataceae bacterium]